MTLDEAIKHCNEVAESNCDDCGAEHKQLAEWLIELKEIKEGDYKSGIAKAIYDKGYKSGWNSCISAEADGWMVDYI
jgi:hypothetical protein